MTTSSSSTAYQSKKWSKLELRLACKNLYNSDAFSKSDPAVVVSVDGVEKGRTEYLRNNLNPEFKQTVMVDYRFEDIQQVEFTVVDVDGKKAEVLGVAKCRMTQLVSGSEHVFNLEHPKHPKGQLMVHTEQVSDNSDEITMQFKGQKLAPKDTFTSDPYLRVFRMAEGGHKEEVYKTRVIKTTNNPVWPEDKLSLQHLCNGDYYRPVVVECWDEDAASKDDYMGEFEFTLAKLAKGGPHTVEFDLLDKTKQNKKVGTISLTYKIEKNYTFIDYLKAGCELNMMVAVDCTGSNKDPEDPDSLHHMTRNNGAENQYVQAIRRVGDVLSQYDSDGTYPMFGFGARLPGSTDVSHGFPMTLDPDHPEVKGVDGLIKAYKETIPKLNFSGPTIFSEILALLEGMATPTKPFTRPNGSKYYVLVILTDGEIEDMNETVKSIIRCSRLPCSIIILGIGDRCDFAKMKQLDDDKGVLKSGTEKPLRDIVQFVQVKQTDTVSEVCSRALEEIPSQLVTYMKNNQIVPGQK